MRELSYPPNAQQDEESVEVLRAWIVQGGLEIAIHPSDWAVQPEEWGRLLADAAEHMADAIAKEGGKSRNEIYRTIVDSLLQYLDRPSSNREGEFLHD
jgi:hypothetical protein